MINPSINLNLFTGKIAVLEEENDKIVRGIEKKIKYG
jgi:hypothetical protein